MVMWNRGRITRGVVIAVVSLVLAGGLLIGVAVASRSDEMKWQQRGVVTEGTVIDNPQANLYWQVATWSEVEFEKADGTSARALFTEKVGSVGDRIRFAYLPSETFEGEYPVVRLRTSADQSWQGYLFEGISMLLLALWLLIRPRRRSGEPR